VAVLQIVVAVLLGLAAGGALYRLAFDGWLSWRRMNARRVVVNLKTGRALDGVLVRKSGDLLFLRNATALEPGSTPAALDGEAVVARSEIDFIQAL
jgi:hypothetical protein